MAFLFFFSSYFMNIHRMIVVFLQYRVHSNRYTCVLLIKMIQSVCFSPLYFDFKTYQPKEL